jgi:DNA uptake protein ComE-like DNA-binding protein
MVNADERRSQCWFLILILLSLSHFAWSETQADSSTIAPSTDDWHILLEDMTENGMNVEQLEERLTELVENPVSLNEASREQLENIPFLSAEQVESLSYYLYRYGPMKHLSELLLVEGMDARIMRWMKPFVRIEPVPEIPVDMPPMKKAWNYGVQELGLYLGSTLQKQSGYQKQPASGAETYAGDPLHLRMRYGFNYKQQLQWGIVLEKDPGESYWNRKQGGVDFASFHFTAKDAKRRNQLFLGDFTVRYGQGLVCGNTFSLGKSSTGNIPEQTGPVVSRHFSASENGFFRGAALKLTLIPDDRRMPSASKLELLGFASTKLLDASINNQLGNVLETGLHRNKAEIESQNRLRQSVCGVRLLWKRTNTTLGLNSLMWMKQNRDAKILDAWNNLGSASAPGGNLSAEARFYWNGLLGFGEWAIDQKGAQAILFGASCKPTPRWRISILGRKFDATYQAPFGYAFSEGGSVENEEGVFLSTDVQLGYRLRLSGYLDVFRQPGPSDGSWMLRNGQDLALELNRTIGRSGLLKLQIRGKTKEKSDASVDAPIHPIQAFQKYQLRLQSSQEIGDWNVKTTLSTNRYHFRNERTDGLAMAQDVGYAPAGSAWSVYVHLVLFNTEAWENRIYLWEKDLPGNFSMPMLYGHGTRSAILLKYEHKNLLLQFKVCDLQEPDLAFIGSGGEQLVGHRRTDVRLQVGWKF